MKYRIYCDESCHLEHDDSQVMVLGAVWCPDEKTREINKRIREIKAKYSLRDTYELKWTKISPGHFQLYNDIVDYFFDDDDLHFRGVIIPNKQILTHTVYGQTHDEWYYKMFFNLLKNILDPDDEYRIFLDYKDTQGGQRIAKLHDVICNNYYDFSRKIVKDIQLTTSHTVGLLQLTDILTGAVCHENRITNPNAGKDTVIARIKERSGNTLQQSTLYRAKKINLLLWYPGQEPSK